MLFGRIAGLIEAGDLVDAAHEIAHWRSAQPDDAGALTLAARVMRLCGRYDEATTTLDRALGIVPGFVPALVEMARTARTQGHAGPATEWFARAWQTRQTTRGEYGEYGDHDWPAEWMELLAQSGRNQEGRDIAAAWCERDGSRAAPWFTLGLVNQRAGELNAAFDAYSRAMQIDADLPMLRSNLAALYNQMKDAQTARRLAMDVIRGEPENSLAWVNLSTAYLTLRQPENALIAADRACVLAPSYIEALSGRISALKELQRWDEALAAAIHLAQLAPHNPRVQWTVAMLQLVRGDYANGLINHEARWQGSGELAKVPVFRPEHRWQGENLAGKTLFVWGEQGFGDALQFVRFVPLIAERVKAAGGTLAYNCFAGLLPLFQRSLARYGIEPVAHNTGNLAAFDFHLPIGSLPLMLGMTPETLPVPEGYLLADADKIAQWRGKLGGPGKLRVGLVWSGSRGHQRNPLRSIDPMKYAQTFAGVAGVEFYSLQVDDRDSVVRMREAGLPVNDPTPELASFDDTAALMSSLDLVITVCTSVAHLGGALGVPTWLLLDVNPHWVWMLERSDSPWYSSLRLFRQSSYGDWSPVLEALHTALQERTERHVGQRTG